MSTSYLMIRENPVNLVAVNRTVAMARGELIIVINPHLTRTNLTKIRKRINVHLNVNIVLVITEGNVGIRA